MHALNSRILLLALAIAVIAAPAALTSAGEPAAKMSEGRRDDQRGTWLYTIQSPAQKGPNTLEVLLPDRYDPAKACRVVYVLPVEVKIGQRWGDGLMEIRKHDLHNRHNVICAQMSFDTIPWFMNHATDPQVQQETYLKEVVSLLESRYKTPGNKDGRLLLGFSKSGWGAIAMVLRNPDFFGFAASWDAPLMLAAEDWKSFEIPKACGTQDRFAEYRLVSLVEHAPPDFTRAPRLAILGEKNFGAAPGAKYGPAGHTKGFHELLESKGIQHIYRNDIKVEHHWESGWVKPAMDALLSMSDRAAAAASPAPRP